MWMGTGNFSIALMQKLMAANRGEIAIRIMRAATELGLRTVAIYSKEDRLSLHRFKADEAYQIGEGKGPVEAYLDVDGIVAVAKEKGVDAIHPGYGFLSENPALPRACAKAGITFVGPSAGLLELLGDKTAARRLGGKSGRAGHPGYRAGGHRRRSRCASGGQDRLPAHHQGRVRRRRARHARGASRRMIWRAASRKPPARLLRRFGNGAVFLERYIRRPRHIEVQILGRHARQHPASLRARLLGAAPASEGGGSRARGRISIRQFAQGICDAAVRACARGRI